VIISSCFGKEDNEFEFTTKGHYTSGIDSKIISNIL